VDTYYVSIWFDRTVSSELKGSRRQLYLAHPCKERKDGAASVFVLPAKSKTWTARPVVGYQ
jgi:hypothetical protein